MAEEIDVSQLEEVKKKYEELNAAKAAGKITTEEYATAIKNLKESYRGLMDSSFGLAEALSNPQKAQSILATKTADLGGKLTSLGSNINTIKSLMGPAVAMTTRWGAALADPTGQLNSLSSLMPHANAALKNLRNTQLTARTAVAAFGGSVADADDAAKAYPRNLRRAAFATGITADKLNELVKQAKVVPGSLKQVELGMMGITKRAGEKTFAIAALETVMRGMGFEAGRSTEMAKRGFEGFGQATPKVVSEMGRMKAAADEVNASADTVSSQIVAASEKLAIFGRGIGESTTMWRTFATTLSSGGVPIKEIGGIVEKVTSGIAGMSVQQRAFVSMMGGRGGGRGALAGALRMELEMRQPGGMNRQLQDLTRTLARFGGGRIITLEQAARTPGMEQQFLLQRQMLSKLGIQGTAEQQNRILEVLNKVQSGGMSQVEGTEALNNAFETGKSIQEKSLTTLERIEQWLRIMAGEATDEGIERIDDVLRGVGGGLDLSQRSALRAGRKRVTEEAGFEAAAGRLLTDITNIPQKLFGPRVKSPSELIQPRENLAEQLGRITQISRRMRGLTTGPATIRRAPQRPLMRVRTGERAPTTPMFRALTTTVRSGDERKLRLLSQIRDLTREQADMLGVATGAPRAGGGATTATTKEAGGTTNTLVIRILGGQGAEQIQEQSYKMILGRQ